VSVEAITAVLHEEFPAPTAGVSRPSYMLVALIVANTVNDLNDNRFYAALGNVARKANINRDTVRRCVSALVEAGVLTVLDDRAGSPTEYRWEWFGPRGDTAGGSRPDRDPAGDRGRGDTAGGSRPDRGGVAATPRQTQENPTVTQGVEHVNPTIVGATAIELTNVTESFDAFWQQYPRNESKPQARAAWASMTVDQRGEALAAITHWRAAADRRDWGGDDGRFIPYAVKWLRTQRWLAQVPRGQGRPQQSRSTEALLRVAANDPRLA
jgi:hypothetical protein